MSINILNLNKEYQQSNGVSRTVLRDINIVIPENRFSLIIGKNGCGKSTLLNSIAGLTSFDTGRIEVKQNDIDYSLSGNKRIPVVPIRIRKKIGIIFQNKALWNYLNINENITHPLTKVFNHSKKSANESARYWLQRIGLEEKHFHKYPNQLSGGEQRKAAIARTLATEPEILLIDELEANLDQVALERILNIIEEDYIKKDKTLLVISHRIDLLERYAPNVIFLNNGDLINTANSIEELTKNEKSKENLQIIKEVIDPSRSQWYFANQCLETARRISELNIRQEFSIAELFIEIGNAISNLISQLEPKHDHLLLIVTKEETNHSNVSTVASENSEEGEEQKEQYKLRIRSAKVTDGFELNGKEATKLCPKIIEHTGVGESGGMILKFKDDYEKTIKERECFIIDDAVKNHNSLIGMLIDTHGKGVNYQYSKYNERLEGACHIGIGAGAQPLGKYSHQVKPGMLEIQVQFSSENKINNDSYYEFSTAVNNVYLIAIRIKKEHDGIEVKGVIGIDTTSKTKWPNIVMEQLILIANMAAVAIKDKETKK